MTGWKDRKTRVGGGGTTPYLTAIEHLAKGMAHTKGLSERLSRGSRNVALNQIKLE